MYHVVNSENIIISFRFGLYTRLYVLMKQKQENYLAQRSRRMLKCLMELRKKKLQKTDLKRNKYVRG